MRADGTYMQTRRMRSLQAVFGLIAGPWAIYIACRWPLDRWGDIKNDAWFTFFCGLVMTIAAVWEIWRLTNRPAAITPPPAAPVAQAPEIYPEWLFWASVWALLSFLVGVAMVGVGLWLASHGRGGRGVFDGILLVSGTVLIAGAVKYTWHVSTRFVSLQKLKVILLASIAGMIWIGLTWGVLHEVKVL